MNTTSKRQKVGLVLAGLYSALNILGVLFPTPDGQDGPPIGILIIDSRARPGWPGRRDHHVAYRQPRRAPRRGRRDHHHDPHRTAGVLRRRASRHQAAGWRSRADSRSRPSYSCSRRGAARRRSWTESDRSRHGPYRLRGRPFRRSRRRDRRCGCNSPELVRRTPNECDGNYSAGPRYFLAVATFMYNLKLPRPVEAKPCRSYHPTNPALSASTTMIWPPPTSEALMILSKAARRSCEPH